MSLNPVRAFSGAEYRFGVSGTFGLAKEWAWVIGGDWRGARELWRLGSIWHSQLPRVAQVLPGIQLQRLRPPASFLVRARPA